MAPSYGESLLRQYLEIMVPDLDRIYNYRPDWLRGLELDIYFPQARVGVEFNGDQHYFHTGTFGDPSEQMQRDRIKRNLCNKSDVRMICVTAIDLEWTVLNGLVKNVIVDRAHEYSGFPSREETRVSPKLPRDEFNKRKKAQQAQNRKLRPINKLAAEYRRMLVKNYNSPTARKKKKGPRRAAEQAARNLSRQKR